jgi:hypothetical protein
MLPDCKDWWRFAYAWFRQAADRKGVLQKLVAYVGTDLGRGAYPVTALLCPSSRSSRADRVLACEGLQMKRSTLAWTDR